MTATSHALVAGFIATAVPDPAYAGLLSYGSHFVLDSIPHWDFGTNWRNRPKFQTGLFAIFETIFGITLSYVLLGKFLPVNLWATSVLFGLLPDWLETPWYIVYAKHDKVKPGPKAGMFEKTAYLFYKLPNVFHTKAQAPLGIITQLATIAFFYLLLMR